ncbi:hypothetical protein BKA69DRAFT_1088613 [Paraphysoderma sedebokerense]|nr:hypothetical protein BKA69DRAFT_1088613 [Paraphysoderma sedebokerense]
MIQVMRIYSLCAALHFVAVFFSTALGQTSLTAFSQNLTMKEGETHIITLSASTGNLLYAVVDFPPLGELYQFNLSAPSEVGKVMLTAQVDDPLHRVVYKAAKYYTTTTVENFSFIVQDLNTGMLSGKGNISITVLAVNDPPICGDSNLGWWPEEYNVYERYYYYTWDPDTDYSNLNFTITYVSHGVIEELNDNRDSVVNTYTSTTVPKTSVSATHAFIYRPPKDFVGSIHFNITLNDGLSNNIRENTNLTEPCTFSIHFGNVEDPPLANDVLFITDEDNAVLITLNCTDVDPNDAITEYKVVLPAGHGFFQYITDQIDNTEEVGKVLLDSLGRFWFSPIKDFSGAVEVNYQCKDKDLVSSNYAVATIIVNPVNDPPFIFCPGQIDLSTEFVNGYADFVTIKLSAYDAEYQNISFKIIETVQRGFLFGDGKAMYRPGDYVIGNTVIFNANNSGASVPYANFSFVAIDEFNASSEVCVVRFNAICERNSFLNTFSGNAGRICAPCPRGAVCSDNGSFFPIPTYGYWKDPERNDLFLECTPRSACFGNSQTCSIGYSGRICAKCASGYFRLNTDCVPCRLGIRETLGIAAAVVLLGGGLLYLSIIASKRGPAMGLFGLFVNFVQTVIVIRGLELPWPEEFQAIINVLSVLNLNLDLASPECFMGDLSQFRFKMKAMLALPGIFVALLSLCGWVGSIHWGKIRATLLSLLERKCFSHASRIRTSLLSRTTIQSAAHNENGCKTHSNNSIYIIVIKIANIFLSLSYLNISKYALGIFDCVRELDGNTYLESDKSLQCYQEWWYEDIPIAIFGIMLYVIGVPLLYSFQLFVIGKSNWANPRWSKFRDICEKAFIGDSTFREGYQFCVLLQLFQKLALLLINMFFSGSILPQVISMLLILQISFLFYWTFQPYAYKSLNYLEIAGIGCSTAVLLAGVIFHVPPPISEGLRKVCTYSILTLVIGYLVAVLLAVFYEYKVVMRKFKVSRQ